MILTSTSTKLGLIYRPSSWLSPPSLFWPKICYFFCSSENYRTC